MTLATRDRRAVVAGLGVLVAALLFLKVVPGAIRAVGALDLRVGQQRELLSRMERGLRDAPALEDSATKVLDHFRRLAFRLLPGTSDGEAADELAHRIEVAIVHAGGRMLETTPVSDTTRVALLHRVSLRASFEGDLRGLVSTLRVLERDSVVITIDALRIVGSDGSSPDDQPETLRAEVLIRGWYSAGSTSVLKTVAVR